MKSFLLTCLLLLNTACVAAAKAQPTLQGLDTFGSQRLSAAKISQKYGPQIEEWALLIKDLRPESLTLKKEIETDIKNQFGFAYVDLSLITYFAPHPGRYVTVDVVEPEDAAKRMAFLPEPKNHFEDPEGLIALWDEYQEIAFALQKAGAFEYPKTCPAWHCTHGFENPKLAPFLEKFNRRVPLHEEKLVRILKDEERPQFRANAAFLLAHLKSGPSVVQYALASLRDSSGTVRNNTARVLSEIASKHPEIEIPVGPLLQMLEFPAATDRNKAGYALAALSKIEKNKNPILKSAGPTLLAMLKLQQPNNHDPAYQILKNLSGENFDDRDYNAWEKWVSAALGRD